MHPKIQKRLYFSEILEFSVVSKQNNACQMLKRSHCPSRVSIFSNFPCLSVNIFGGKSNLEFTRCLYSEFVSSCKLYIIKAYGS